MNKQLRQKATEELAKAGVSNNALKVMSAHNGCLNLLKEIKGDNHGQSIPA